MNKKFEIEVRKYGTSRGHYEFDEKPLIIERIKRVLKAEQIGNFNPLFCRYKNNKRVLVHSDEGDLSDPFRRNEEYSKTLFIEV
jgi:hypothetical protein